MSEDMEMKKKAAELGFMLKEEDGVLEAIKKIDEFCKSHRHR
jgi:hypothetical protein